VTTSDERPKRAYFRLDVATGRSEDLRIDGGLAVPAPTGNTIYYRENIDRLVRHDLDIGSSMEIALVKNGLGITEFSVSPDGKQVAYTVNGLEPGSETKYLRYIAIIPASGGEPREVHHHSNNLGGPSRFNALEWTPDQKYLLFVEEERVAGSAIWRVPAAGGQAEKIGVTMNARIKSPFIHPDGKSIFFTAVESDNNEVWALENFLPAKASTK
jgi:Tol biopolymer transport system component